MKKSPLLNIALSQMIASLGHGDMLVIGDAGLPSQPGVPLIDLALTRGIPGFIDTVNTGAQRNAGRVSLAGQRIAAA